MPSWSPQSTYRVFAGACVPCASVFWDSWFGLFVPLSLSQNSACSSAISVLVFTRILSSVIQRRILPACETSSCSVSGTHCLRSPFFGSGMNVENVRSSGHSPVSQITTHILCILSSTVSPPALMPVPRQIHPDILLWSMTDWLISSVSWQTTKPIWNRIKQTQHSRHKNWTWTEPKYCTVVWDVAF